MVSSTLEITNIFFRREELFGIARNQLDRESSNGNSIKLLPTKLSLSSRGGNSEFNLDFTSTPLEGEDEASRTFTQVKIF